MQTILSGKKIKPNRRPAARRKRGSKMSTDRGARSTSGRSINGVTGVTGLAGVTGTLRDGAVRRKGPKRQRTNRRRPGMSGSGTNGWVTGGSSGSYGKRKRTEADRSIQLPAFTPWKIILASFLIGICGLFYIRHVFSTQQTLEQVQQLEAEFNQVNRLYEEKRLEYDRLVGPKEIYQRAQEHGFVNAGPADRILILER